jgi:hypothetical protein
MLLDGLIIKERELKMDLALCVFSQRPWEKFLLRALELSFAPHNVKIYQGYPEKFHDVIFLIGVRPIVKLKLDQERLKSCSKFIVEFGDYSSDSRSTIENRYYWFVDQGPELHPHYRRLPKFVFDWDLWPEHHSGTTVLVDHKVGKESCLEQVFEQLDKSPIDLTVRYHSHQGIIENPTLEDWSNDIDHRSQTRIVDWQEMAKWFRTTDIFIVTHKESQGQAAYEAAKSGAIVLLKSNLYPKIDFPCIIWQDRFPWDEIQKQLTNQKRLERLKSIEKLWLFSNFQKALLDDLSTLNLTGMK